MSLEFKYNRLINWIRENGGFVNDKLAIGGDNQNRYIYLKQDIQKDELVIDVPMVCCILSEKYSQYCKNNHPQQNTIFGLLTELSKGDNSFYKPYLDILPKFIDFSYHPFYQFNDNTKIEWGKISSIFVKTVELQHVLVNKVYDELKTNQYLDQSVVTLNNVKWAYLIAISRQWGHGLVPFADMLQHSNTSQMPLSQIESNIMKAPTLIKKNYVIYDSYGIHGDLKTLSGYGFVDDIENDDIQRYIPLDITITTDNNTLGVIKKTIIDKLLSSVSKLTLLKNGIHTEIIKLLRVYSLSDRDFKFIDLKTDFYTSPISIDNENGVMKNLLKLVHDQSKNITNDELTESVNVVKSTKDKNSISYKLAKAVIYQAKVINNTIKSVLLYWNKYLDSPFEFTINFTQYDKILKSI